jgi:hypothetical protein
MAQQVWTLVTGFGLRGKLLRRIGGAVLVIFIASAWLNYNMASNSLQQQAEQTGNAQAQAAAKQIDGFIQTVAARSSQLAGVVAIKGLSLAQLRIYERDLLAQIPTTQAYDDYMFFDNKDCRAKVSQV